VPSVRRVFVTARESVRSFRLVAKSLGNKKAYLHADEEKRWLRSGWYHTGNGVASDGKSLYVIGHGMVAKGESLNNVRNSTLIQFDLKSRAVLKETPILIEDFPESLLYSPC
jgi:hypothetical protein